MSSGRGGGHSPPSVGVRCEKVKELGGGYVMGVGPYVDAVGQVPMAPVLLE